MFRPIRRTKREISIEQTRQLLSDERRGVLAVNGDDGYPYAIPINFIYDEKNQKIYFHGARAGYKYEAIKTCEKVCFTVYGNESIKKEAWAPYMQSAVVFGRCHLIDDQDHAIELVKMFARKYFPDEKTIEDEVEAYGKTVQMFEIDIEHMSGKEIQEK